MKRNFIYILIVLLPTGLVCQELGHGYYNYLLNNYNVNPAYTGYSGNLEAVLNAKSHMAGLEEAPRNLMFGISSPVTVKQNLGGRILADSRGAFKLSKIDLTYSYLLNINDAHKITFGASSGLVNRRFNGASLNMEYLDQTDPTLMEDYMNETNFVIGTGLLYQYKELEIGISSPHLVEDGRDISNYLFSNVAYLYQIGQSDFQLKPMLIFQKMPVSKNKIDYLVRGIYDEKLWTQIGYQSTSNFTFGLGFDLGRFSAGYIYEMNNSEFSNISNGSNQIMIQLTFASNKNKKEASRIDELNKKLDNYIETFNKMLVDKSQQYTREVVYARIKEINTVLNELKNENNLKNAEDVAIKLITIEEQINALEIKYKQ